MKKINLIGDRYGRLIVLKELNKRHGVKKERVFQCLCDCGNKVEVPIGMLRNGNKKSCGCLQREARYAENRKSHGMSSHELFHTWYNMRRRCYEKDHDNYPFYGAKGVVMEDRWKDDVVTFINDVENSLGKRPKGFTLDRIDPNGNYFLDNLRWANKYDQALNKRNRSSCGEDYISKYEYGFKLEMKRDGYQRISYIFKDINNAINLRELWIKEWEDNPKKWKKDTKEYRYKKTMLKEVLNIDDNKHICLRGNGAYAVEVVKRKIRRRATVHSFDDAIKIRNQWLIEYFENPSKWIEDTKNKSFIRKI